MLQFRKKGEKIKCPFQPSFFLYNNSMDAQIDTAAERPYNPLRLLFMSWSAISKKDYVQRRHAAVSQPSTIPLVSVISFYGIINVLFETTAVGQFFVAVGGGWPGFLVEPPASLTMIWLDFRSLEVIVLKR